MARPSPGDIDCCLYAILQSSALLPWSKETLTDIQENHQRHEMEVMMDDWNA